MITVPRGLSFRFGYNDKLNRVLYLHAVVYELSIVMSNRTIAAIAEPAPAKVGVRFIDQESCNG